MSNLLQELDKRVEQGLLKRVKHPRYPLLLYGYTPKCQFDKAWDEYTRMARGLIVTEAGVIIARPFSKFFNYGEPGCDEVPAKTDYQIFEKIDGSLGIWFYYDGRWNVATRGSFENDFTDWAQQHEDKLPSLAAREGITILTEICMPQEMDGLQRAVPHKPGLYLLGARHAETGKDISIWDLDINAWLAGGGFLPGVKDGHTVDTLLELIHSEVDTEGWVIRWDDGTRVKVKTEWYKRLCAAILGLENVVREKMVAGIKLAHILKEVPEELHQEATEIYAAIQLHVAERQLAIRERFFELLKTHNASRKTFAIAAQRTADAAYMFMLYDGGDPQGKLIEQAPVIQPQPELVV